jgi:hypothetical protein
MWSNRLVGVCVATVLIGCVVDATEPPVVTGSTVQGLEWACDGVNEWDRRYMLNGVEIGRDECYCDRTIITVGQRGGTRVQVLGQSCTPGGGGGGGGGGGDGCRLHDRETASVIQPGCL